MALSKEELEEMILELKNHKGRATELISVYISAGYDVNSVQRQLEAEKSTAKNIKSTSTRKNVGDALDKIVRELKNLKKTPDNGIALFCGNVSKVEGQDDLKLWIVEPTLPLKVRLYRCDKEFVIEPLEEMISIDEIYGLLVMDRKEATIGMLEGKRIELIQHLTSGVPSKVRAGGQCLSPDTLIMGQDGEILEIKDSHNPLIIVSENLNSEKIEKTPIIAKWDNTKDLFKITTCYPKFQIKSSLDHTFFVRTGKGIEEKPLREIKEGDYLLMPEGIQLDLEDQEVIFSPKVSQEFNLKKVNLPKKINPSFAKILGYYLGDGSYELDRISFSEQRKGVAEYYSNLISEVFDIIPVLKFREDKNYWQTMIYSRIVSQLFRSFFPEEDKTFSGKIPSLILKSSDKSLAGFISGFFDAEGYVSKGRVAFRINNSFLAHQFQLALLRLGVISSISEYNNEKNPYSNNIRYTLAIDDIESLKIFRDLVNFSSHEKKIKLDNIINSRSIRNKVRQIVVNGSEVAKIIRNSGLNTRDFNMGYFFCNKRQISKELFRSKILDKINDPLLKKRLELFYNSNLIALKISKIESVGLSKTIDIETKNHNFIANGLLVHNSSQRFHRITEGLTKEFYKRIAEEMKNVFFENTKLKGIIIGGPIPTKDEFIDGEYLPTKLQEKIIGRIDVGDTDESGLKELVEKSHELLASQEAIIEKRFLTKFFETLGKNPDFALYKIEDIRKALTYGAVNDLIISKSADIDIIHEFKELAVNSSAEIHMISTETTEGIQFSRLSGFGALLRFKI